MADQREEIQKELLELVKQGEVLLLTETVKYVMNEPSQASTAAAIKDEGLKKRAKKFELAPKYQGWYSRALRVVEQLLPDRHEEFRALYRPAKPPKELDITTYTISHYLAGVVVRRGVQEVVNPFSVFQHAFNEQINILRSAADRLDSLLADITGVLEAQIFDDELEVAEDLRRKKHLRAAGVVAGVVLERHLKRVVSNHAIAVRKKAPTIADLNDLLKKSEVYDTVQWRGIQRLGDIRNIAGHDRERQPTDAEIDELIRGVEKTTKTLF